ncbi:MAG: glycosyltransferase, partial [Lachnospiraceae bacterium]|nr:glycosyltransferase [Lachnospiraceae bacterium]
GKQLYLIDNASDEDIDMLYKHAFILGFPSVIEGFGLPAAEAMAHGLPVITSQDPALREVVGEYGLSFDTFNAEELADKIADIYENREKYDELKEKLKTYEPVSWDMAAGYIMEHLIPLAPIDERALDTPIKQVFMISARQEDLERSLPFIENHMPFIKELVLLTPDDKVEGIREAYHGRLKVHFLTDSQVCAGIPLPKDHQKRNFFLRQRAIRQDIMDEVFIMADDDARALYPIDDTFFREDGKYNIYYFYNAVDWHGRQREQTSYDIGQHKFADFAVRKGMPTYQFSAHMPQVIEKKSYIEMLDTFLDPEDDVAEEWDIYLNYMLLRHPAKVNAKPYVTLSWPATPYDWETWVKQPEFVFENFYDHMYETGIFRGLSSEYYKGIEYERFRKIDRYNKRAARHAEGVKTYNDYVERCKEEKQEVPCIVIDGRNNVLAAYVTNGLTFMLGDYIKLKAVLITDKDRKCDELEVRTHFLDPATEEPAVYGPICTPALFSDGMMEVHFATPDMRSMYKLKFEVVSGDQQLEMMLEARVLATSTDDLAFNFVDAFEQVSRSSSRFAPTDFAVNYGVMTVSGSTGMKGKVKTKLKTSAIPFLRPVAEQQEQMIRFLAQKCVRYEDDIRNLRQRIDELARELRARGSEKNE